MRRVCSASALSGRSRHAAAEPRRWAASASAAANAEARRADAQRIYTELKQKFGYMGAVDHSTVGAPDLFQILRASKAPADYQSALQAMNMFYNFGVKLKHREIASRLLATAMTCKVESEAADLIKLYGTWLEHPPDTALVYAVMAHFLDAGKPVVVREIAQAVREDWRMPVEPPLYALSIEAMLRLPETGVAEALLLHEDARSVGVRLPAPLHARLLVAALSAFDGACPEAVEGEAAEVPDDAAAHLRAAALAAEGLVRDGHLRGFAPPASLFSVAWLFLRLATVPEASREAALVGTDGIRDFMGSSWQRAGREALDRFGSQRGTTVLPPGFFRALEAFPAPEAAELAEACRVRLGRFYPKPDE